MKMGGQRTVPTIQLGDSTGIRLWPIWGRSSLLVAGLEHTDLVQSTLLGEDGNVTVETCAA